jgi:carotenoid cleavage dioxygenase
MNAMEKNEFLSGNFAPVREELSLECPEVEGVIPDDLSGYFLRTGPNPQFDPIEQSKYHWFDGDGMIHEMRIQGGKAHYQNRWVRTKGFNIEREEGKSIWKGFQSLHELEFHHGLMTKNLANTALIWHGKKLLALWEAGLPHSLSLPDLETIGEENFEGTWESAFSAHPTVCPETGEMITFGYNVVGEFGVTYGVFDVDGKLKHKTDIKLKGKPVMIHDCAITPDYTLILDMPVTFSLERAMAGGAAFGWEPENGARIGVIPRYGKGEEIRWFDFEVGYIFHVFNAWQEGDEVVLEACRSNCTSVISDTEDANNQTIEDEQAKPHQYRMNMASGEGSERPIDDIACEFSRINEAFVGKKNRFVYASRFSTDSRAPRFDGLIKFDRERDENEIYAYDGQVFSGEFIFAPKDGAKAEDEGYLLGFVQDEENKQSEFYIIDTQNFSKGPVAKIKMPSRVPYGFHATWVADNQL